MHKVAPILSEIFLCKVDGAINKKVGSAVSRLFRYVDDYLIFVGEGKLEEQALQEKEVLVNSG